MVLSEEERRNATIFLKYVPDNDLDSIAQTVTKGMVTPTSVEECIKIIVLHSDCTKSLLSRKKITKEILFKYLHDNNAQVVPSMEKNALIQHIVMMWSCTAATENCKASPSRAHLAVGTVSPREPVAPASPGVTEEEVNELACQFSQWFYTLLNAEDLGPEHFWQDCNIYIATIYPGYDHQIMKHSAEDVVQVLHEIKHRDELYFNPNLSVSGVKGKLDPHGLVMVFTCGTLHQVQKCVGLFEQLFCLTRDPFASNNWKIKSTKLRLRSQEVERPPVLQEEGMTQLLTLLD